MCQSKAIEPATANSNDFVWGLFNRALGFPGKLQGFVLNAIVNTIDRVQTEQALKETRMTIAKETNHGSKMESASSNNVRSAKDNQ